MEEKIKYFETCGKENTEESLRIAKEYVDKNSIKKIVVASTTGYTAEIASKIFKPEMLAVVTHVHGFREGNSAEFPENLRNTLESKGIKVITSAHGFGGVNSLSKDSIGSIIANTLRTFSQGMKVCMEIASQAADSGIARTDEDMIAIAGTGRGADTVMVIRPAISRKFFECKVRKILAMPE